MPEGVEVRISAELIKPLVVGKQIRYIKVGSNSRYKDSPPKGMKEFLASFRDDSNGLTMINDCKIIDVQVKGKFMYWTFNNGWYMFSTFGMTGQWSPEEGKHMCLHLALVEYPDMTFNNVYFNDPRHFGTIQFVQGRDELLLKLNELGWDPLNHGTTEFWTKYVVNTLARTTKPIGQVLMDQGVFAGVGNYIRAEALYLAKMSPWRPSNKLKREEIVSLCQALVDVMNDSYKHQGATILTYKDAYGAEGKYSGCFKVYGQKKDPLGNPIIKEDTPDKRTIHWCPAIQV